LNESVHVPNKAFPNEEKLVRLQRLRGVKTSIAEAWRKQAIETTVWTAQEWEFLYRIGVVDQMTYRLGRHGNAHD
jgi:hypothetical protein